MLGAPIGRELARPGGVCQRTAEINDAPHAGGHGRFQNTAGALDIGSTHGRLVMLIHMGIGGQVEDGINAGAGKGQSGGVEQVALKAQAVARIGPGLRLLPRVGMHATALFQQALHQAAADEAGGTGDEDCIAGWLHGDSGGWDQVG